MQASDKNRLKSSIIDHIIQRMDLARKAMELAQEAANSEEKSSMGDKYETGRAMSMQERDQNAKVLAQWQDMHNKLQRLDSDKVFKTVETGALVQTENTTCWISVALGAYEWEGNKLMIISPVSPLAQAMLGKKAGDTISFQGKPQKILAVS